MNYEAFLFTRNTQRDFTAFVRPSQTSNRELSAIASAVSYIHNIDALTAAHPALYCFPLGAYIYLLRYYDSGRKHAGRHIATLEGIAVPQADAAALARQLAALLHSPQVLHISATVPNIETQTPQTSSAHTLSTHTQPTKAPPTPDDARILQAFAAERQTAQLVVPFNAHGWRLLTALAQTWDGDQPLQFAYGANADMVKQWGKFGAKPDVVGYFNATQPALRNRANNATLRTFSAAGATSSTEMPSAPQTLREQAAAIDAELNAQPQPKPSKSTGKPQASTPAKPAAPPEPDPTTRGVLTPRELRQRARQMAAEETPITDTQAAQDAEQQLFEGEVLTPREMRKRWLEEEARHAEQHQEHQTHNWLLALIRKLFGKS